jgi:hypothetical protein
MNRFIKYLFFKDIEILETNYEINLIYISDCPISLEQQMTIKSYRILKIINNNE